MVDDADSGVGGDRHGARADRDVRLGNADDVEQQRTHRQRAAAANQASNNPISPPEPKPENHLSRGHKPALRG